MAEAKAESISLTKQIFYGVGTTLITIGTFLIGRKIVRGVVSDKEERKSFDENSPATYAKRIKMAFDNDGWYGTNTKELRRIMQEIPSRDAMKQVSDSYQRLYHAALYKDMGDELQTTEYNEMLAIVSAKPDRIAKKGQGQKLLTANNYEQWARRLKAAFDKTYGPVPGTDETAITAVLEEIPTQTDFVQVGVAYQKLYAVRLIEDLKSESDFGEYSGWMRIITSKP
jgi:hypothetical protein